jgi:uncharacterized protein YfaS (alpha-2-macroglobulin family)
MPSTSPSTASTGCERIWPGAFKVGPATLQSMYAPEFTAYSAGHRLEVVGD